MVDHFEMDGIAITLLRIKAKLHPSLQVPIRVRCSQVKQDWCGKATHCGWFHLLILGKIIKYCSQSQNS